jgi:threonine dehydrogenase-like Zn-dependent dehydrogenase
VDLEPLITGRVGIEGVPRAFEDLGNPEAHAKILVKPSLT